MKKELKGEGESERNEGRDRLLDHSICPPACGVTNHLCPLPCREGVREGKNTKKMKSYRQNLSSATQE